MAALTSLISRERTVLNFTPPFMLSFNVPTTKTGSQQIRKGSLEVYTALLINQQRWRRHDPASYRRASESSERIGYNSRSTLATARYRTRRVHSFTSRCYEVLQLLLCQCVYASRYIRLCVRRAPVWACTLCGSCLQRRHPAPASHSNGYGESGNISCHPRLDDEAPGKHDAE